MLARSKIFSADSEKQNATKYQRFAIYYTPASKTKLAEFGSSWFGYDLEHGEIDQTGHGLPAELATVVTRQPARYGFHATLKAPFYLSEDKTLAQLVKKTELFAAGRKPFTLGRLKPSWFGSTMVLVPAENSPAINQFASQCVLGFEDFRAPLTVKERTRRLEQNLNLHQRLMLEELGYPFVLSEFRFHLTLTRSMNPEEKEQVTTALAPAIEEICAEPCLIDSVSLVGDPGNGEPFELIERFNLGG